MGGEEKGEVGDSESKWPPGLCWIQNSCQDEQNLSLYRRPVQGLSSQCAKSNIGAKIIILRSDCDSTAVLQMCQEPCEVQNPFSSSRPGCLQRGNSLSRLLQSEPEVCYAGRVVPGRQGRMCSDSACVMTNVSNLVFVTGLKLKLSINKEPHCK